MIMTAIIKKMRYIASLLAALVLASTFPISVAHAAILTVPNGGTGWGIPGGGITGGSILFGNWIGKLGTSSHLSFATTTRIFTTTNASTTNFTASSYASTSKFFADGLITCNTGNMLTWAGGIFGCEDDTSSAGGGFDFTPTSVWGQIMSATGTGIRLTGNPISLAASSTAWFDQIKVGSTTLGAMSTSTFYGNVEVVGRLRDDSISSALTFGDALGNIVEYEGTSCTNQFVRSLNGAGAATCETVANTDLANSTISGVALGGTLFALTNDATLAGSSYNGSSAISDWGLNLTNANTWTGRQNFGNATSTLLTFTTAWGTKLTLTNASTTNLTASQSFFVASKKVTGTKGFSSTLASTTLWAGTSSPMSAFGDSQSFVPNYSGNISSLFASTSQGTLGVVAITDQGSLYCKGITTGATCNGSLNFTANTPIVILGGTRTGSPTTTVWSLTATEL